jgi:hypothetical protein
MHYIAMAVTSFGVSAWQEPSPVLLPTNLWFIGSVVVALTVLTRVVVSFRARSSGMIFWVAAAAAFLPVSPIQPFAAPMADCYLYFMLPGLRGGSMLAARSLARRFDLHVARRASIRGAVALVLMFGFGWHRSERGPLWESEAHLLLDATVHYPKGSTAAFMRARRAAEDGEVEVAVGELRLAADLGVVGFMALPQDPGLAPLREEPAFKALVHELAVRWIIRARARGYSSQPELRVLGMAHLLREEYREAVKAFRAAIEVSGRLDAVLAAELEDALFLESSVQVRGRFRASYALGSLHSGPSPWLRSCDRRDGRGA